MNDSFGRFGENVVARWLRARGNAILPIRDIDMRDVWKGPRMTGPEGVELVTTDWLVTNTANRKMVYIEVKNKTAFTWHRISNEWVTGIDQRYLDHYLIVRGQSSIELWLLFLHLSEKPSRMDLNHGCPDQCPTGLFGQEISLLADAVHHTHANWGKGGMVYWGASALRRLATLADLTPLVNAERSDGGTETWNDR